MILGLNFGLEQSVVTDKSSLENSQKKITTTKQEPEWDVSYVQKNSFNNDQASTKINTK